MAFHPSDANGVHELYFMCDSLKNEIASLAKKGVKCTEVQEARWGSITKMSLPGGGEGRALRELVPAFDVSRRERPKGARHLAKLEIGEVPRLERFNPGAKDFGLQTSDFSPLSYLQASDNFLIDFTPR